MRIHLKYRSTQAIPTEMFSTGFADYSAGSAGFFVSLTMHAALLGIFALLPASLPPLRVPGYAHRPPLPTEIRIGKQLYFVTELPEYVSAAPNSAKWQRDVRQASAQPRSGVAAASRPYIPPQIYTTQTGQTLIQPAFTPDLIPVQAELPSFEIHFGLPRYHRRFVVPGRGFAGESGGRSSSPPNFEIPLSEAPLEARAIPLASFSPGIELPKFASGVPPEQAGDPIEIISVNPSQTVVADRITIPPGNVIAIGGTPSSQERPGEPAVMGGEQSYGNILAWTPGGDLRGTSARPAPRILDRLPTGDFDTVIVQSSGLPFGEGHLLRGRPVYTVYIATGTPKDWALYFCLADEAPAPSSASVIQLGSMPVIRPPWPTHLVVPAVAPIPGEKHILVYGSVGITGNFEHLRIVRPEVADVDRELIQSLEAWRFRAATKDGVPVAVEAILSIPVPGTF